jgi:hypothetical protein
MPEDEDRVIKISSLRESAIFDHEMFHSWIEAGFTREEALVLLRDMKHDFREQNDREED